MAASEVAAAGDQLRAKTANGVAVVKIRAGRTVEERLAAYGRRPGVVYAEPNYIRGTQLAEPNDPSFDDQWGLGAIRALSGWGIYPASYSPAVGTRIAVVDTGVDSTHPDLAANVDTTRGANCLTGACVADAALDDHGHGTHVAGIAAAVTNNGVGIAGVAFSSKVVPVKVLAEDGLGSDASIASGILWAVNHGARVVNLSLGGYGFSQTICDAVAEATSFGALLVAAAGNDGTSEPLYPAACPGAVGVAATDSEGFSPSWSNWNSPNVFVSAPGASIFSTYWRTSGPRYATLTGTSMATPHTAGLAALILGRSPSLTPSGVKRILARSAEKLGADLYPPFTYGSDPYGTCAECTWHPYYGYGEIDVATALSLLAPPALASFAPTAGPAGAAVTLTGSNFVNVTSVTMGHVPAAFTAVSPTQINATVPAGQPYGRWRVTSPGGTSASAAIFSVPLPQVTGLSTILGPVGSPVVITGSGFHGVSSVTMGFVPATFTVVSPTQIAATVPGGQPYGRWRVTNPTGTTASDVVFAVGPTTGGPTFTPTKGPAGTVVTLTGSSFTSVSSVTMGFVPATFTVNSPVQITATVPAGSPFGRWRVTTSTGTAVSDLIFSVPLPQITGLNKILGPVGSSVTISGSGFQGVSSVTMGFVPATFTVVSPTQITATVPGGAPFGRWRVTNPTGTAAGDIVFAVGP